MSRGRGLLLRRSDAAVPVSCGMVRRCAQTWSRYQARPAESIDRAQRPWAPRHGDYSPVIAHVFRPELTQGARNPLGLFVSKGGDMLALSVREFCNAVGISPRTFWNLVKKGEAPPMVRIGRRRLIRMETAEAWLKALEQKPTLVSPKAMSLVQ